MADHSGPTLADLADGRKLIAELGRHGELLACFGDDPTGTLDVQRLAACVRTLAERAPRGPALSAVVHLATFLPLVRRLAAPELSVMVERAGWGAVVGSIAATEADRSGTDLADLATTIRIEPDQVTVSGTKDWVTSGLFADETIVVGRHRTGRHFSAFSLVLVPTNARGVSVEPVPSAVMTGSGLARLTLDDVTVPRCRLLGRPGRGFAYFIEQMAAERLAGGVWAATLSQQLVARTAQFLRRRHAGDGSLWEQAAVRQELGRAAVDAELLRALADRTVDSAVANARLPGPQICTLKAAVGLVLPRLVERCIHLHGAPGLTATHDLVGVADDVRAFGIGGGVTEAMLEVAATEIAGW